MQRLPLISLAIALPAIALVMMIVAVIGWAVVEIGDQKTLDDRAKACESAGYVWLGGSGVSEPGCYDLRQVTP